MKVYTLSGGYIASDCYLCVSGDDALLIDPSVTPADARRQLGADMVMPSLIVLTHAHFDHMLCLDEWRKLGIPLAVHELDVHTLGDPEKTYFAQFMGRQDRFAPPEKTLKEGDVLTVSEDKLTVLHTPGHTVGCICLLGTDVIFTGDTVFCEGGYGRTDLWSGNETALYASICRLKRLAKPDITMYPGHGPSGDFADEMKYFA